MENEAKVFHSAISRVDYKAENHLYDLLKVKPATPALRRSQKNINETWEFTPNNDKHYIPRKGSKLKVKTVGELRKLFEKDIYSYLPNDLEKQQKFLLRKIRDGSSNEEETKKSASRLMNADNPISRSAWQMLVNINPEKHNHPKQFVLWNGKYIQVNGSRGGKTKFICSYDLKNGKKSPLKKVNFKNNLLYKPRLGLLRNSLNIKFKPGPLRKKTFIDDSHHRYQMGHIEVIKLPIPVLEISPTYGTVLEPAISNFINDLRGETGTISQKLAEFAVSVLGKITNQAPAQLNKESCITFDLNYKCDQNRLLMSRSFVEDTKHANIENRETKNVRSNVKSIVTPPGIEKEPYSNVNSKNESLVVNEIKKVLDDMLNSIEISVGQDTMCSVDDVYRETIADDCADLNNPKDKPKRKYGELGKLDVTVIKLPESSRKDYPETCEKSFCVLGCICESLQCEFKLKQHCGALDCMFGCKCEVAKYKELGLLERDCSEMIPGLLNLDNEINSHMAKEEQKFHQTVIVSGEKSIMLKSRKRTWKSSKKYAEFYGNMNLKTNENIKRILTVDVQKLCCNNIEPICMVHNLYKCFCKGKFTDFSFCQDIENKGTTNEQTELNKIIPRCNSNTADKTSIVTNALSRRLHHSHGRKTRDKPKSTSISESCDLINLTNDDNDDDVFEFNAYLSSARTMGYIGRKYTDGYYKNTNNKILEMEQNDKLLKKKLCKIMNGACDDNSSSSSITDTENRSPLKTSTNSFKLDESAIKSINNSGELKNPFVNPASGKHSLRTWLERSYKCYKERVVQGGVIKNSLDAPKKGKASLQSWDFILSRYRERKNIFFVSLLKPFRTFLAVDDKHPFFATCTNIDDIRFADLHKYPIIIRNLVTNATDSDNSFCILRGWDHCWELIGSAVKVIERAGENHSTSQETFGSDSPATQEKPLNSDNDNNTVDSETFFSHDEFMQLSDDKECKTIGQEIDSSKCIVKEQETHDKSLTDDNECNVSEQETHDKSLTDDNECNVSEQETHDKSLTDDNECNVSEQETHDKSLTDDNECKVSEQDTQDAERSKWFVMTIENDFTEIQFYKRGFFVTYDGIQRSICLARISGKTVRLSSQARTDKNTLHQFGIYAIPCIKECCVFIGPYEITEPLGIEVVKTFLDTRMQTKTRGVWITTNKVDNIKVIEHPLSFMPSETITNETMVSLESSSTSNKESSTNNKNNKQAQELSKLPKNTRKGEDPKVVKPIKIRRTNGFYHLSPNNILKKIAPFVNKPITVQNNPGLVNPASILKKLDENDVKKLYPTTTLANLKPVAEIAPSVNISGEPSQNTSIAFVKPIAEIAPQIKITSVYSESDLPTESHTSQGASSMLVLKPEEINKKILAQTTSSDETDIEKFLETSTICIAPQDAVFVISDGEEEDTITWTDVWIKCVNVDNFGYIRGRKNEYKLLSFEFPGFKFSEFYTENEAFNKINQVLARKIYIPKYITLRWKTFESKRLLKCDILSAECLMEKKYLLLKLREIRGKKERQKKINMVKDATDKGSPTKKLDGEAATAPTLKIPNETAELIDGLEEASKVLENESTELWKEALTKRNEIVSLLSVPDHLKAGMSETLQVIMSMNENP